jgi:hypothetical protein
VVIEGIIANSTSVTCTVIAPGAGFCSTTVTRALPEVLVNVEVAAGVGTLPVVLTLFIPAQATRKRATPNSAILLSKRVDRHDRDLAGPV